MNQQAYLGCFQEVAGMMEAAKWAVLVLVVEVLVQEVCRRRNEVWASRVSA